MKGIIVMKKRLFGFLMACLMLTTVFGYATAAELSPTTSAEEEPVAVVLSSSLANDISTGVSRPVTVEDPTAVIPVRSVSQTKQLNLAVGKSWSLSFNMNASGSPHNAFNVVTSNMSGKYKYIITGSQGYSYESGEYNNQGTTFTTSNAWSNETYTVYIVNTGTTTLTGTVQVSSYYK